MPTYFAITRHAGQWFYVNSGQDPHEVYLAAIALLDHRDAYPDEPDAGLSPEIERQIDSLRVVPETIAQQTYHVILPHERIEG